MSTRHRSARPSATPASSRARPNTQSSTQVTQPPRYVVPSAPLNEKAITELERLTTRSRYAEKIKEVQGKAVVHLTDSVVAANEAAQRQQGHLGKLQARVKRLQTEAATQTQTSSAPQSQGDEGENGNGSEDKLRRARDQVKEQEPYVVEIKRRADAITGKAEEKLRGVIDSRARVRAREEVLREVSGNVVRGEGRVAPTQSTLGASQFRTQPNLDDEDEDEDGEGAASTQARQANSVLNSMQRKVAEEQRKYDATTMRARYGQDNDYAGFKKSVHDAIHHDDGVRVPHYSQWFPSEPGDADDVQMGGTGTPGDAGEDSDIEVAREVISTKCPITLMELKEVLTAPCDHNFEAGSIKEMISMSNERAPVDPYSTQRRAVGPRIIRCPVSSCECKFTEKDLRIDRVMRRKIARIQEQNRLEEEAEDNGFDDSGNRAVDIGDETSRLSERRRQSTVPVKPEPRSSMPAPRGHSAAVHTPGPSVAGGFEDEDDEMDEDFDDEEEY